MSGVVCLWPSTHMIFFSFPENFLHSPIFCLSQLTGASPHPLPHLSLTLSCTLNRSCSGCGSAWGKVAEEGGEEGKAHSCGCLIESLASEVPIYGSGQECAILGYVCVCEMETEHIFVTVHVCGHEDWSLMLVLLTACFCVWRSEQDFLSECVLVLLLLFSSFLLSPLSFLSAFFTHSVQPAFTSATAASCLFSHKENSFRVSKEEKVAWLKSPVFNCGMPIHHS